MMQKDGWSDNDAGWLKVMTQKMDRVTKERDEMQQKHETHMLEWQQRASLKHMHLEKSVRLLQEELEKREAQVAEITIAANLDGPAISQVQTA